MEDQTGKPDWFQFTGEDIQPDEFSQEMAEEARQEIQQGEDAVAAALSAGESREEGTALAKLGETCFRWGQIHRAVECMERAAVIFQELGDKRQEAEAYAHLGLFSLALKEPKASHTFHTHALTLYHEIGDLAGFAKELRAIAWLYSLIKKSDQAIETYQTALALSHEIGDCYGEANTLNFMGAVYLEKGQFQYALPAFEQALQLARKASSLQLEANVLNNLSTLFLRMKDLDSSLDYNQQALEVSRRNDDRSMEALVLQSRGLIYHRLKDPEEAVKATQEAVHILDETGGPGADSARAQLETLKSPPKSIAPVGLFAAISIVIVLVRIFLSTSAQEIRSSSSATAFLPAFTNRLQTSTGALMGTIIDQNGNPLVDSARGEIGIVALICTSADQDVECLRQNDLEMEVDVLLNSICNASDFGQNCLLHWGSSATRILSDGSYTISAVMPGQYELLVLIIHSGSALSIHLRNVDPVIENEITVYNFKPK